MASHFTSVKFSNYKAFKNYSVTLSEFNILVGANNAGKSTVIGAFRILAEALRRANAKRAIYSDSPAIRGWAYPVNLRDLPVSTENVFTNYDDSEPAVVEFRISNGNRLKLIFPERDSCYLVCLTGGRAVQTPSEFKREFDVTISFVPVLGPVEHDEELNQEETARRALLTHRASRNFRNIWYHFSEGFDDFRSLVQETWPGMDIERPELSRDADSAKLHMFCPEDRYPREIFWAGFGFQVWCQMLTFITKAPADSLLIIDEPDIYLHSDLQRQLVHILRTRVGDVLIATHSTEILAEAESGEIVVLNKRGRGAQRVQNPTQLQSLFGTLGSSLNPTITQLAKTKKVIFVEGDDFGLLAAFCRKLGQTALANRASFAVIPARGFNPARVSDFSDGMETTLGIRIERGVIFDRDYRSETWISVLKEDFSKSSGFVHIHDRKELENFLLVPAAIDRAIRERIQAKRDRGGNVVEFTGSAADLLGEICENMKSDVFGQYNATGVKAYCDAKPGTSIATASSIVHKELEQRWSSLDEKLKIVPGKLVLSELNSTLQAMYGVSVTTNAIVAAMRISEIPADMAILVQELAAFAHKK